MHDDAILTRRDLEGSADFEEADASRCLPIIGCDWTNPPANAPAGDALRGCYRALWAWLP